MSEWEDEDFGSEFYKFQEAPKEVSILYDDNVYIGYIKPYYDSIVSYTNDWNKTRKKIRVENIVIMKGTPYTEDRVEPNEDLWLDMGARLFKAIKPFALKKVKFLKILKFVGHKSKFDVRYVVSEYKLKKQTKVDAKSKK